jgi:hypothetical protein
MYQFYDCGVNNNRRRRGGGAAPVLFCTLLCNAKLVPTRQGAR